MTDTSRTVFPKGRGARLLEALQASRKLQKQDKPGEEPTQTLRESPPPVPKGRAALLQKLRQTRAAVGDGATTSATTAAETTIVESLATTTLTEPCLYRGLSGSQITTACNYIRLSTESNRGVFEYNVKFRPEVDAKSIRFRMVAAHVGPVKMFDGGYILFLPIKLEQTEYKCVHPHDNSEVTMTITFVKQKNLGECLQLFNILFKRIMRALLFSPIGRNYFDPNHTHLIPQHKLEILPGYAVAVDEYEGGVMLCLDTQHRVMRTQSVYDCLRDYRATQKDRFKEVSFKQLIGQTVLTRYNNKSYRIDDILWDETPESTFNTDEGRAISFLYYYKAQYGIDIVDAKQPLLVNVQTKKMSHSDEKRDYKICLIPELCYMTGLTDEMRADFKVMKDVALFTRVTPNQRVLALRNYLENIEKTPAAKKILEDWGLKINNATIDLLARVLDAETILFGEGVMGRKVDADWNSLVTRNKVLGPIDIKNWFVFYTPRDTRNANDFAQTMQRLGGPMGVRINKPTLYVLKDDRTETYMNTIRSVISDAIQIFVFICPTIRDDRYSMIKRLCCAESPIPSQVVLSRTLNDPKKVRAVIQKIALQMNCKLGGTLWSLRFPVKKWMICGIDVYHSPGSKMSVCAFISSINDDITRWYSTSKFQELELSNQLRMAFAKSLEKYREINGFFPSNVIIYRDGVGDGQLKHCQTFEIPQFENCLKDLGLEHVKLTMIIVQKRINTRVFLNMGNVFENPTPGTVVDNTITRRNWYDFFLVAQHVRQGTVTPTHYIVLHDTAKLKPDHVQKLTFKLCHLYYNWPGTIRVPAPCQYAHKLAYLVGQHIRRDPSTALSDRLYYL